MIAHLCLDPGGQRTPLHHKISIGLRKGCLAQLANAPADGPEQRPLCIAGDAGAVQIGVQIALERVAAGHLVPLAALFPQADPQTAVLRKHILNPHGPGDAHPREAVDHQPDQRPVPQPDRRSGVDGVQPQAGLGAAQN